ncbi:hypothetical protein [Marivita hallyeonensis]|uniref:Copper(I)-binding protein n=1 Tax=Marivita hallyeonensis TaxID=996342 RepID=A0A1M5VSA4_9RHOB|nr:hypothetical protein [Marivita hallyeonensis]SHH77854.1 hypothetical protein SAMN05443551_3030 [Marivita hallyeonensis]
MFKLIVPLVLSLLAGAQVQAQTLAADGNPILVDLQQTHPNGVILQVSSVQAGLSETVVSVQVINGFKREIRLLSRRNDSFIASEDGTRLFLSPPEDNERFELPAMTKLEGELVFLGRLPETDNVTFVLNDDAGSSSENSHTPRFEITIALPEGTFSEGSKKN